MLKVVKTEISEEDFIKEVQELFPGKYTTSGLKALFYHLDWIKSGEYELYKIGDDFVEWSFEKYCDYAWRTYTEPGNKDIHLKPTEDSISTFLHESICEDDWHFYVAGITDSTILFTIYYSPYLI